MIQTHTEISAAHSRYRSRQQPRRDPKAGLPLLPHKIKRKDRDLFLPTLREHTPDRLVNVTRSAGPACLWLHKSDPICRIQTAFQCPQHLSDDQHRRIAGIIADISKCLFLQSLRLRHDLKVIPASLKSRFQEVRMIHEHLWEKDCVGLFHFFCKRSFLVFFHCSVCPGGLAVK